MAQPPSQLIFSRLTKNEGLVSNAVFQTIQDKQGYLWIATQNGLQRYDGHHFLNFHAIPRDSSSIPGNSISRLFIDRKDRLWIVSGRRTGIFSSKSFRFSEAAVPGNINFVRKIVQDVEGRILLFADIPGVFVYDEKRNEFLDSYSLPNVPDSIPIRDMISDTDTNRIWIASKQGLFLYDKRKKIFYPGSPSGDPVLKSLGFVRNTRHPYISKDGSFWLTSWVPFAANPELYRYNPKKGLSRFTSIRDFYHEVWDLYEQKDGTLWIYGVGLLAYYNQKTGGFTVIPSEPFAENHIQYDAVNNVFEDKDNNVWISTNRGLFRFNSSLQVFRHVALKGLNDTGAVSVAVASILQTKNAGIWVGTWGKGIFSYDKNLEPIPNLLNEQDQLNKKLSVVSMIERKRGEIWLGLRTGVIKIVNTEAKTVYDFKPTLLKDKMIWQLLEDKAENVWIGAHNGELLYCQAGNWRDSMHSLQVLHTGLSEISKLYEDRNGNIWICTVSNGLYTVDGKSKKIIRHLTQSGPVNKSLPEEGVTSIVQFNDSMYLITGNYLNTFNANTGTFRYLTVADGLPVEHSMGMIADRQNKIWVSLAGGLYRYDPEKNLVEEYSTRDGIINGNFELNASTITQDGKIVLGTSTDLVVFDPAKLANSNAAPNLAITGIKRAGLYLSVDSVLQLNRLSLPYDNTFLTVEFSTFSYSNRYKTRYMLEGLDKEWRTTTEEQVSYPYLPPGNYILKIKSLNAEGIESGGTAELRIFVSTPFWKSWWFYAVLVLILAGLLYWDGQRKIKRKELMYEMRSNIADSLHQEVNTTLNNINILSEVARIKADNDAEQSKEYIRQIQVKSSSMIVAMNDMLWSINPDNDNMPETLKRLQEYIDGLNIQGGVRFEFANDEQVKQLQLTMQVRYYFLHVFRECLDAIANNAKGRCSIHLTKEKDEMNCSFELEHPEIRAKDLEKALNAPALTARMDFINARLDSAIGSSSSLILLKLPLVSASG
jgi:ligand-binding sensor domain-containing protein/signal transduction histidine kinase